MPTFSEHFEIEGPCGKLEMILEIPAPESHPHPIGLAVLAHPHPLHGGNMEHKIVQTLARACVLCGYRALRFNFRGTGKSEGEYTGGDGELEDLLAALAWLRADAKELPIVLGGFSFGAYVAARASLSLPPDCSLDAMILIGTATGRFPVPKLADDISKNTIIIHGDQDETVPLASTMAWAEQQMLPITIVPGSGHFFHGRLPLLRSLCMRHILGTQAMKTI